MSIDNLTLSYNKSTMLSKVYALLAATMIPTGVGAYLGISMNFQGVGLIGFLVLIALMFGTTFAIRKGSTPVALSALFFFTFIMGLMLSLGLNLALSMNNGGNIIATAAAMTVGIFAVMSFIGATTKSDLSGLSGFLTVGAVIVLIGSLATFFFHAPIFILVLSGACALLFSIWLMFDINRVVNGGETNAILATLSIYLSLVNIFQSLLNILMILNGSSRD